MRPESITTLLANPLKRVRNDRRESETRSKSDTNEDTWEFGGNKYKHEEGGIPTTIAAVFEKRTTNERITAPYDYDRTKLSVFCYSGHFSPKFSLQIELSRGQPVADITSRDRGFDIFVFKPTHGKFPLTVTEFLKAVCAAKLDLYEDDNDDSDIQSTTSSPSQG